MDADQRPTMLEPRWGGLVRLAGVLLVASGIVYGIVTYLAMATYDFGAVPTDAATYLTTVSPHALIASTAWSMWICADLLLLGIIPALFVLLRRVNLTATLFGTGLLAVFVVFDIAVTELNSLSLVSLAQSYTGAGVADQARYLAAATGILAGLQIETLLSFVIGSLGLVILSVLLFRGPVRRATAWLGVAANSLGIVGGVGAVVPALAITTSPSLLLIGLWYVLLGAQLIRFAGKLSPMGSTRPERAAAS